MEPDLKEAPSNKLNHIHGSGDNNTTILNSNNEKQVKNRAKIANLQNYLPKVTVASRIEREPMQEVDRLMQKLLLVHKVRALRSGELRTKRGL